MSNVPTWKRSQSNIEFLHQTYELAILVGRIVHNTAGKYKDTYGAIMIHNCERALYHGRVGNRLRNDDPHTFYKREDHLNQMIAEIDNVATYAFIWFEEIRQFDGVEKKIVDKTYKWEEQVGGACDDIIRIIEGVMRSDRKTFKQSLSTTEAAV